MQTSALLLIWVCCALLGVAVGYGLRKGTAAQEKEPNASAETSIVPPAPPPPVMPTANEPAPSAAQGLQTFPPGFEGMSLEAICRKGPLSDRYVALQAWAHHLPREEVPAAVRQIYSSLFFSKPMEASMALAMMMARWGEKDPELALAALKSNAFSSRTWPFGWGTLLASMGHRDPAMARRTFEDAGLILSRSSFSGHLTDFGIALGKIDPQASLQWASALPGTQRTVALSALMQSGQFSSAEAAESLRPYLHLPEVRQSLNQRWSRDDPSAAAQWMKPYYASANSDLLETWSEQDPKAALAWAQANLEASQQAKEWPGLASSYARHDPEAASEWVGSLPDGEARVKSIEQLAAAWDDEAALTWVRALPNPVERDAGLLSVAKARQEKYNFTEAIAVAATAEPDNPQRQEMIQASWRRWHGQDPGAASHWLQSAPLPASDVAALRSLADETRGDQK